MEKTVNIKWASPDTAIIKTLKKNNSILLSKEELIELQTELSRFISFYEKDFGTYYENPEENKSQTGC